MTELQTKDKEARAMGLLTDPSTERSRVPELVERHHRFVCALMYLGGLAWFLSLAYNPFNHGTYFSENALLPGLVQGEFRGEARAREYLEALMTESERYSNGMPHAWLAAQLTQLGLDTYTHNFTLNYPFGKKTVFKGKNVYGILRAVRGSSTEAIVVSVPYRPPVSLHQGTGPSIALMLAMAHFFREQVYWAKDLIFLVTEHEQLGAQAWLEAYHRANCGTGILDHGDLEGRAGAIQAAVNLEIHSPRVSHVDVKIEGLNGQLPNLDLVNLVHRLCQRENVKHTFKNRDDHPRPDTYHGWLYQVRTLIYMVATQASGVPNGNHGLFHRFGIEAVTLEGFHEEGRVRRSASLHQLGRVLEGICRSLNNLLERFHQSFFFYLLPSTNRYISIGVYMPPFGLLGGALLLKALALWFSTSIAAETQELQENSGKKVDYSLLGCVPLVVMVHLVSVAVALCPLLMTHIVDYMPLKGEDCVFLGILAFSLSLLTLPLYTAKHIRLQDKNWGVVKCVAVLELAVLAFATAVYNFSLALVMTTLFTPIVIMCSPTRSRVWQWLQSFLLLLVHPLPLLFLLVFVDTYNNFDDLPMYKLVSKSYTATKRALMYSVVDALIYSNWLFEVASFCLLPLWLLFWNLIHYPSQ